MRIAGVLLAGALLAGAAQANEPARPFPFGQAFVALSLAGEAFAGARAPSLTITTAGGVSGSTGCNAYSGRVAIDGAGMSVSGLVQTRMMCPPPAMDNERLFSPALSAATGWRMDGTALVIESARGPLRFVPDNGVRPKAP